MHHHPSPDWDRKSPGVQRDQRAAFDVMRRRCPIAYSEFLGWSLFRRGRVTWVRHDPDTFGNAVSPYGTGLHACPGAPLMHLELRVFMDEWLSHTDDIATVPEKSAMQAVSLGSGPSILPLRIR